MARERPVTAQASSCRVLSKRSGPALRRMCVEWVSESAWNPQDRLVFCIVSLVLDLQRVHPTHTFVEGVYTFRTSAKPVKLPGMITLPYLTLPYLALDDAFWGSGSLVAECRSGSSRRGCPSSGNVIGAFVEFKWRLISERWRERIALAKQCCCRDRKKAWNYEMKG